MACASTAQRPPLTREYQQLIDDGRRLPYEEQQRAIANNRGLAGVAAGYFHAGELDFDELVAIGFVGLTRAARGYDPSRGIKFSTYAVKGARSAISNAFRQLSRNKEVAYRHALRDPVALAEFAADGTDADGDCDRDQVVTLMRRAIESLTERERTIIEARPPLGEETLREIGDRLGMSKERVRQLEARARGRIREMLGEEALA